jgi:hypothetical protein
LEKEKRFGASDPDTTVKCLKNVIREYMRRCGAHNVWSD